MPPTLTASQHQLMDAVFDNDLQSVKNVIYGPEVYLDFLDDYFIPLLNFACANNELDVVETALEKGVRPNLTSLFECSLAEGTLLMQAIKEEHLLLACELVQAGVSLNIIDHEGWTPLTLALRNAKEYDLYTPNDVLRVNKSISKNITVETINKPKRDIFAKRPTLKHHLEFGRFLIEQGADIHQANHTACTPLMLVCSDPLLSELASPLLERGAEPNGFDSAGRYNPLISACDVMNEPLLADLLAYGSCPNVQDYVGFTPLIVASNSLMLDSVRRLIQAGAELNTTNEDGRTALLSTLCYNRGAAKLITEMAATSVEHRSEGNVTTLDFSKKNSDEFVNERERIVLDVVKCLLAAGSNPMIRDSQGYSACDLMPLIPELNTKPGIRVLKKPDLFS